MSRSFKSLSPEQARKEKIRELKLSYNAECLNFCEQEQRNGNAEFEQTGGFILLTITTKERAEFKRINSMVQQWNANGSKSPNKDQVKNLKINLNPSKEDFEFGDSVTNKTPMYKQK